MLHAARRVLHAARCIVRLVRRYNMNPAKLETMGRGSQELLVPAGNVEEQAPNRRVEVLLRPSGPAPGARPVRKVN